MVSCNNTLCLEGSVGDQVAVKRGAHRTVRVLKLSENTVTGVTWLSIQAIRSVCF